MCSKLPCGDAHVCFLPCVCLQLKPYFQDPQSFAILALSLVKEFQPNSFLWANKINHMQGERGGGGWWVNTRGESLHREWAQGKVTHILHIHCISLHWTQTVTKVSDNPRTSFPETSPTASTFTTTIPPGMNGLRVCRGRPRFCSCGSSENAEGWSSRKGIQTCLTLGRFAKMYSCVNVSLGPLGESWKMLVGRGGQNRVGQGAVWAIRAWLWTPSLLWGTSQGLARTSSALCCKLYVPSPHISTAIPLPLHCSQVCSLWSFTNITPNNSTSRYKRIPCRTSSGPMSNLSQKRNSLIN